MSETELLIPKTIKTFYSNTKYFRVHQAISIIFFIYYIYASIVNTNDGLPWSVINTLQFSIASLISIGHIFIKNKDHWLYFLGICIVTSIISFAFFIYWLVIYFSKSSRGNIAIDSDGQDMAGYFILFIWYIYLVFVSYNLSKSNENNDEGLN